MTGNGQIRALRRSINQNLVRHGQLSGFCRPFLTTHTRLWSIISTIAAKRSWNLPWVKRTTRPTSTSRHCEALIDTSAMAAGMLQKSVSTKHLELSKNDTYTLSTVNCIVLCRRIRLESLTGGLFDVRGFANPTTSLYGVSSVMEVLWPFIQSKAQFSFQDHGIFHTYGSCVHVSP